VLIAIAVAAAAALAACSSTTSAPAPHRITEKGDPYADLLVPRLQSSVTDGAVGRSRRFTRHGERR